MLRKLYLASETTVQLATTTVIIPYTALRRIGTPPLARVHEPQRLGVVGSYLHLKHGGKLAVEANEVATRNAELRNAANDIVQCIHECHVQAILAVAAVGARGALVFLILHDVCVAPAGGVALCEMGRAVGWLGTGKSAEREGGDGEEGGDCAVHLGRL